LLRFAELAHGDVMANRAREKKVFEIPFNSTNKFQVGFRLPCIAFTASQLRQRVLLCTVESNDL